MLKTFELGILALYGKIAQTDFNLRMEYVIKIFMLFGNKTRARSGQKFFCLRLEIIVHQYIAVLAIHSVKKYSIERKWATFYTNLQ